MHPSKFYGMFAHGFTYYNKPGSIMYGYFYIGFINFMLNYKSLRDFTNLFSPNNVGQLPDWTVL